MDRNETVSTIYGILAMLKLYSGDFLFVIKKRELITRFQQHSIYTITELECIRVATQIGQLNDQQKKDEDVFVDLIMSHANSGGLLYSTSLDLTLSMQKRSNINKDLNLFQTVINQVMNS